MSTSTPRGGPAPDAEHALREEPPADGRQPRASTRTGGEKVTSAGSPPVMAILAKRLRMTEGQLYTAIVVLLLAAILTTTGLPTAHKPNSNTITDTPVTAPAATAPATTTSDTKPAGASTTTTPPSTKGTTR
ncbi:MAG TPA: hypothetical protein VHA73_00690 [Acidimicrobiales bacterium]|nr:hypothetical protein [Acidimicrobiales bacterium]